MEMRPTARTRPALVLVATVVTGCAASADDPAPRDASVDRVEDARDAASDGAADVSFDVGSDAPLADRTEASVDGPFDVVLDAATDAADAASDASIDVSADGAGDVAGDGVGDVASDGAGDIAIEAAVDAATGACSSDASCGGGFCLLGRCARYTDESLPTTSVPSPDRCRLRVGVDQPSGAPLRLLTVVAGTSGDTGYESVRTGAMWMQRTLSTNVNRYTTPRFHRAPGGALEVDFAWGVTVALDGHGSVMQSGFSAYETAYSPTGELDVVVKHQGPGSPTVPYPLRLWRPTAMAWASELVASNIGTDATAALHHRADGTPDVLVFDSTRVNLYRKSLDVWNMTTLYTGSGTHAGGAIALHDPRGGTHVFFGTRVFTSDLSVGELTVDYLLVASDGTISRRERLDVGGHGFTLLDATLGGDGRPYAMITGPSSGGRYPTHVVRVDSVGVSSSVVANFESAVSACSLAVAPDATMYLAAYQGYLRPVLLRTFTR